MKVPNSGVPVKPPCVVYAFAAPPDHHLGESAKARRFATSLVRYFSVARQGVLSATLILPFTACMVGPDFVTPTAPIAAAYLESGDLWIKSAHQDDKEWWTGSWRVAVAWSDCL
jgi:hypothetical protein